MATREGEWLLGRVSRPLAVARTLVGQARCSGHGFVLLSPAAL